MSTYYVSDTTLSTLHALTHLILTKTLGVGMMTTPISQMWTLRLRKDQMTSLRSHNWWVTGLWLKPRSINICLQDSFSSFTHQLFHSTTFSFAPYQQIPTDPTWLNSTPINLCLSLQALGKSFTWTILIATLTENCVTYSKEYLFPGLPVRQK